MALLQKTLVSGSIWIGSGSGTTWGDYINSHNLPFAIYQNDNPLLYYNINQNSSGGSLVIPTTTSINSIPYKSGFEGEGFKIFANPKTVNSDTKLFWTGQFDDLWVRGSMHVKQFVIDQIRATNGSLYISDAAAAISASFVGIGNIGTMSLYFQTGSTMPFVPNDIIRSKRWIPDGSHGIAHQWDFLAGVTKIGSTTSNGITYNTVSFTTSRTGNNYTNYYYGSGNPDSTVADFASTISVLSSQWVRVGNLSAATGRSGSIYLTSNDSGGPFMDVVSGVNTIIDALGGTSATSSAGTVPSTTSVSQSKLKLRLGNLQGIYDQDFAGQLSGYGMWADNAYLRGWIVANQGGNIAGWKIEPNTLSNLSMKLVANSVTSYIGLGTDKYAESGIWIGTSSAGSQFSVGGDADYIRWDGSGFTVSTPNFRIQTGSVSMSGIVSANSGIIGGWTIQPHTLSNNNMQLFASGSDAYLGVGATSYNQSGIWIGTSSAGARFSVGDGNNNYVRWTGTDLQIKNSNFSMSNGDVSMSGIIVSNQGNIAGWDIFDKGISKSVDDKSIALRIETSSVWNEIDNTGYSFNLESESPIFTVSYKYYDRKTNEAYAWEAIANTSSISTGDDGQAEISFTASAANSYKAIVKWRGTAGNFTVQAGETVHVGLKKLELGSNNPLNTSPYYDKLTLQVCQLGGSQALAYTTLFEQVQDTSIVQVNDTFISYTNTASVGITCSVLITQKSSGRPEVMVGPDVYGITASNLFIGRSRGYTELNPHGLLVYASPTGYIKLTTDRTGSVNQNYAIASFDELYVAGQSIKGGFSGGSGGTTPVDPSIDGTLNNTFTINKDGDSNNSSLSLIKGAESGDIIYDGSQIQSSITFSAPAFSGSGFVFAGTNTALSTVGNITSGQDLSNLSIKQILDAMLLYAKPTVTAPGLTYAGTSYYYETGSTIGAGGTINVSTTILANYTTLMPGTGLTMSFVRNDSSVILGSSDVTDNGTQTVTFNMTAETGSYNASYATSVKATITNSKGVITEASRTIYFRAPVFAFTNTQSSFTDAQFVTAIRSTFSNITIKKNIANLAKGETYTTPANSSGGTVQAYLAWPASWTFTPIAMRMYGNPCGATLISSTMGYTSSVNPDAKLQYKLLAVGDPQTNPAALSLYIED